jgi:DNA polymerase I-like protein with 3'-5' exonuclease and polymerase domains
MIAHHLLFPGTPQGLGYLSSIYCEWHRYWKDDNHDWSLKSTIDDHFLYNGEDCIRTYEIAMVLEKTIEKNKRLKVLWPIEMRKHHLALSMMLRGVRVDQKRRTRLGLELQEAATLRESRLLTWVPQSFLNTNSDKLWPGSAAQKQEVFYEILKLPLQRHKKTKRPTTDKTAIAALKKKAPEFTLLFETLLELTSARTFYRNFISAPLDTDGRMRCSFKPTGTETFRWSSSSNPYGVGTNLQNLPKGDED